MATQSHRLVFKFTRERQCLFSLMKRIICKGSLLTPLQGQPAIERTAGEHSKWKTTVAIYSSSPNPQLCHLQSIAFRKSTSSLHFEMKSIFCCKTDGVCDDDLYTVASFRNRHISRGIFPHCSTLHNIYFHVPCQSSKPHRAKPSLPKREPRWLLPIFWCEVDEKHRLLESRNYVAQDLHVNEIVSFPLKTQVFTGTDNFHLHKCKPPPSPPPPTPPPPAPPSPPALPFLFSRSSQCLERYLTFRLTRGQEWLWFGLILHWYKMTVYNYSHKTCS